MITDHQLAIEERVRNKNMAENDKNYWKKIITPLKEKQIMLCDVVLTLCDSTIINVRISLFID